VARQTRAQRRARREAQQGSAQAALAGGPPTAPPRRPTARGGAQPQPRRQPSSERRIPGAGVKGFVAESWGELKKVEWPNQKQLIQGVVVVLVACFVVGVYLYGADLVFKRVVENVFLR
jgi:preprotein translocase subunit SecE